MSIASLVARLTIIVGVIILIGLAFWRDYRRLTPQQSVESMQPNWTWLQIRHMENGDIIYCYSSNEGATWNCDPHIDRIVSHYKQELR